MSGQPDMNPLTGTSEILTSVISPEELTYCFDVQKIR